MATPDLILGSCDPISSTVNAKTNTRSETLLFTPNNPNLSTGLRKHIAYGPNTPLKKLGVDVVTITKVPGQTPIVRFFGGRNNNHVAGVTFQQGAPEMKTFIKMLKECAMKGTKPDFPLLKTLFKVL